MQRAVVMALMLAIVMASMLAACPARADEWEPPGAPSPGLPDIPCPTWKLTILGSFIDGLFPFPPKPGPGMIAPPSNSLVRMLDHFFVEHEPCDAQCCIHIQWTIV
jgi:hypothetical protein